MNQPVESNLPDNLEGVTKSKTPKRTWIIVLSVIIGLVLLLGIALIAAPKLVFQSSNEALYLSYAEMWPIKFKDAFDGDSLARWKPSDGVVDSGVNRWGMKDGRFEVAFAPTKDRTARDAFFNQSALAPKDFLLTLKIKTPLSCHTGVAFRGSDPGDYYVFLVGNDSYTTEILRRENDADLPREAILPNTPFPRRGRPALYA